MKLRKLLEDLYNHEMFVKEKFVRKSLEVLNKFVSKSLKDFNKVCTKII